MVTYRKGLIEAYDLQKLLSDPQLVLFDCRARLGDDDYGLCSYNAGHIPRAWFADLETQLSAPVIKGKTGRHPLPDVLTLSDFLRHCGLNNNSRVVVYDDNNGAMAARLWWLLRFLGLESVAVLNGGYQAWLTIGGEISNELSEPDVPGDFEPRPDFDMLMTTNDVESSLHSQSLCLVDARAAIRFRGEQEPIDPVAGHIPGALNYPFEGNLREDGRFKSMESLKQRFLPFESEPRAVVCYCGSGVTACHNLLAMELAGLPLGKLYLGSWSEWIVDPSRPLARQ
ncbi:sulfurtransferase [Aestuariirhabdus sp. Z084]|uniref:sulfurtransferase n=1 Tax=Aestuariirhabdus haliotis TaxID=2918751 RepID=UPI00201B42B6|nr:sulfurtransferase [Aestuariirhabdus haliotis]MCL6416775.1 sulfurtransferase [Aestuariirhabdus haliotis]MCL6420760.1 sulfurtransferase [Aestuariirhabdus haliotis]